MDWARWGRGPQHVAAKEITSHYGRWQAPDEDKAATRHRAEHVHHDFFDVWSCHVRDLKEFGVGHMMYFTFLWWMSALFCALTLLVGVPNMAINLVGKYYEAGGQMEVTTLGNFGRVSVAHSYDGPTTLAATATGWELEHNTSSVFMADAFAAPATFPLNKQTAIIAASVIDCVAAAVYFVVTLGLVLLARRRAEDADTHTVTIHDYSVYVRSLPQDAAAGELVDFFAQWGEVESVEIIKAYGNMLRQVLRRGQLLQRLQSAIAALQKAAEVQAQVPAVLESSCHDIKEDVARVDKAIQEEQALGDNARVVGAFVTFRTESSKLSCLKATPHSWIKQWLYLKPEQKFRGRHALMIVEAPEPSDVQFENMEHGAADRACRTLVTLICSYTALVLGFFLISLATASRINVARTAGIDTDDCSSCRLTAADGAFGLSEDDRELYAACNKGSKGPDGVHECSSIEKQCYRCYCYTSLASARDTSYCSSALGLLALSYGSQVGVVLAILGINMLLALTSRRLTLFEKHHTRSSEARTLAHRLFLAQFLNSAVSTIIANAHLPFVANLFDGTALQSIFFQGVYTDLTPSWYKVVGRSLLISQFLGATLRMAYLLMRWGSSWWARYRRGACLTQEELENSLRGPEFLLDHRYGEHLSVIYVSMLLSGAMPIAWFTAAFWFVTSYWCDKLELLKLSRRPVVYGKDLSEHVMNLLPYATVWHVAFALWAFSLFGVYQSPLVSSLFASIVRAACNATESAWLAVSGISADELAKRLMSAAAAHLLVAVMVMVGVLFLKLTLTTWVQAGRWLLNMAGLVADNEDTHGTGAPEFPVAVRTQLLVGETSYAIQDQPAYATAFSRMEHMEEDVCVKVVLKGPSMQRKSATTAPSGRSPAVTLSQQQPNSPTRSQSLLYGGSGSSILQQQQQQPQPGYYYGALPPVEVAAAGAAGQAGAGALSPADMLAQQQYQQQNLQQQQQYQYQQQQYQQQQQYLPQPQAGSRPSTNGSSSRGPSRGNSSQASSRRNSGASYPAVGSDAGTAAAAAGGFDGAAAGPIQLQQQFAQPPAGEVVAGYADWPTLPTSAERTSRGSNGYHPEAAAAAGEDWGGGYVRQPVEPPVQQLSPAQRFRQARTNQVAPIPEEYLQAARNNLPEQQQQG